MAKIKCPNCKYFYNWVESDDSKYPFKLAHNSPLCSFRIVVYNKTKAGAISKVKAYILEKFGVKGE